MDRSSSRCGHYISESRARSSLFSLHLLALQEKHTHTLKYRWVGWSHPDPHGVQLKTFLRVMKRLRSGDISQVEMNVFHTLMYKTNHVVKAEEWQDVLSRAYVLSICFQLLFSLHTYVAPSNSYVWIDWSSMPQPSACPPNTDEQIKKELGTNLGKAVKSIPAYVVISFCT